jgi:glucose-6-phosphate 1-dehydrogenase
VLRFANSLFTPLWNKECVEAVLIQFKEPIGTEGRAGYFDEFGIIRDIAQNHLCQIFALIAMDRPASLDPEAVRDAKVKVLQETLPIAGEECVVGQFSGWTEETPGRTVVQRGYLEEPGVPADSVTPTFAQVVLRVDNDRWRGTPFILKCGKGLNERKAEIRVQFKSPPGSLLFETSGVNELVIRVQPKEAIYLKMNCKTPGLSRKIVETELDMTFTSRFGGQRAPEAYERLISDCLLGDKSNFVRSDELAASWAIFTPLLHKLAKEKVKPVQYRFGGRGPEEADALAIKVGFRKSGGYKWSAPEEKFIGKM